MEAPGLTLRLCLGRSWTTPTALLCHSAALGAQGDNGRGKRCGSFAVGTCRSDLQSISKHSEQTPVLYKWRTGRGVPALALALGGGAGAAARQEPRADPFCPGDTSPPGCCPAPAPPFDTQRATGGRCGGGGLSPGQRRDRDRQCRGWQPSLRQLLLEQPLASCQPPLQLQPGGGSFPVRGSFL